MDVVPGTHPAELTATQVRSERRGSAILPRPQLQNQNKRVTSPNGNQLRQLKKNVQLSVRQAFYMWVSGKQYVALIW